MSLLDSAGKESVQLAMDRADKLIDKADNLVRDAELRLGGMVHGILDRFVCEIHFAILPAKAKAANPPPPEADKTY